MAEIGEPSLDSISEESNSEESIWGIGRNSSMFEVGSLVKAWWSGDGLGPDQNNVSDGSWCPAKIDSKDATNGYYWITYHTILLKCFFMEVFTLTCGRFFWFYRGDTINHCRFYTRYFALSLKRAGSLCT